MLLFQVALEWPRRLLHKKTHRPCTRAQGHFVQGRVADVRDGMYESRPQRRVFPRRRQDQNW